MTPSQRDWLDRVSEESRQIILRLARGNFEDLFGNLRKLFDEEVGVTQTTWEVKNLIASLAMTEPNVLRGRITLQNAAIERLTQVRRYIRDEIATANTDSIV